MKFGHFRRLRNYIRQTFDKLFYIRHILDNKLRLIKKLNRKSKRTILEMKDMATVSTTTDDRFIRVYRAGHSNL